MQIETAAGAVLLAATLAALLLSNSPWADTFLDIWETPVGVRIGSAEAVRSLKEWINDGLMTLFFFLVALWAGTLSVCSLELTAVTGGLPPEAACARRTRAVKLENELHDHFASRRLKWANNRKEFFFASPSEVRSVLVEKVGNLLEFVEHCESTEYYQSVHYWPEECRQPGPAFTKQPERDPA